MDLHLMFVARTLFWLSVCIAMYVYAGHPVLLYVLGRLHPKKWSQADVNLSVAVFISAFNEEKGIASKIRNLLEQDYRGPLKIIVASDGSTDGTAEIVRSFGGTQTALYDFKSNRGKAAMQNEIVPALNQQVIIFSDATSVWPKNAVRNILRNFADPKVGCVAVDLAFVRQRDGLVERGQGAYWRYERFLRRYGALVKTNIVASGTTYAIRRSLFHPIRPDIGEDLSNPLQIAMAGHRVVFDPEVVVEEISSSTHASEMRMRTRIAVRNVTGVASYVRFLNPKYGFAAYQLLIHKYLRVFCWIPMILALVCNYPLRHSPPYGYLFIGQIGIYALALIGYVKVKMGGRSRFTYLPYYFVLLNYACMIGLIHYLKGVRRATWSPDRPS
jgi:cellulose synthase/poly-beta-1,6-N-acetylglucosamine synthase-like glycosyltransferase